VESRKWKVKTLDDMDTEVTSLEGKLSTARDVKAGDDVGIADPAKARWAGG